MQALALLTFLILQVTIIANLVLLIRSVRRGRKYRKVAEDAKRYFEMLEPED